MVKSGFYKMVASAEFPLHASDSYITNERRPEIIGYLRQGAEFQVISSKSYNDGFVRCLIIFEGAMAALRIGEMIPGFAFEKHVEACVPAAC